MGHDSAKNQQMEDHYFGAIPERVAEFMRDLEIQALRLGIPCKTRHNEVAPNQFELAPIYEECNLAVDHNMLLVSLMRKIARKHGFRCLLHEKPFAGINGSGKHCNWSLCTDSGVILHAPGRSESDTLRFLTFVVATLMGVYRHNGLLKASIMSAGNSHRLGGHEAPPAIISSFLGTQISELLDRVAQSDNALAPMAGKQGVQLDIPQIPELLIDNTDRNRTSPFAFTGNRYSEEWKAEAARRGLDCETSCPVVYDRYTDEASVRMFESMHVMTRNELAARNEIKREIYYKKIQIESRVLGDLCMNHIIPVATKYQSVLVDNVSKIISAFPAEKAQQLSAYNVTLIEKINHHTDFIVNAVEAMVEKRKEVNRLTDIRALSVAYHDEVEPFLHAIRYHIDKLELIVEDEMWTLPKYRELLFIR